MPILKVRLAKPANEMAQEEIGKKIAHLSKSIGSVRFADSGDELSFEYGGSDADQLAARATDLANTVQRSLRALERKLVYRSTSCDTVTFQGDGSDPGIHFLGLGQAGLTATPLKLFRYFDRVFEELGRNWAAQPLLTPTLIPATVLAKCDYFRSFPHNVTFAAHLFEDAERIENFRKRHHDRDSLDDNALGDMETPEACLSPAVCYHVYHLYENATIPAQGVVHGICGKCFRYEASNLKDLRRLWDFTMREVVFLGSRDDVLAKREVGNKIVADFLEEHEVAGEIRTASDPFFIAPDASAKTYFQLSAETKYEISLLLPDDERLAVGSLNYHTDFFGRAFNIDVEGAGPMHSVCIAYGLERWVHGFLAQHGNDPSHWPSVIRNSPEFAT
jgi:hypothetical protein